MLGNRIFLQSGRRVLQARSNGYYSSRCLKFSLLRTAIDFTVPLTSISLYVHARGIKPANQRQDGKYGGGLPVSQHQDHAEQDARDPQRAQATGVTAIAIALTIRLKKYREVQ